MSEQDHNHFDFFEMRPQLRHFLARDAIEHGGTGVGRSILRGHLAELNARSLHASAEVGEGMRLIDRNIHTLITGAHLLDELYTYEDTRDMEWMAQHKTLSTKLCAAEDKEDHDRMQRIGRRPKVTGTQLVGLLRQLDKAKFDIEHCLDSAEFATLYENHPFGELRANPEKYTQNPRIRASVELFESQYQSPGYQRNALDDAIHQCIAIQVALGKEEKVIAESYERANRGSSDDRDPNFPRAEVMECCQCDIIPALRHLTADMLHELDTLRNNVPDKPAGTRRTLLRPDGENPDTKTTNVINLSDRLAQRNR